MYEVNFVCQFIERDWDDKFILTILFDSGAVISGVGPASQGSA